MNPRCGVVFFCALTLCLETTASLHARGFVATVTAYCSCEKCCAQWSGGPTASGKQPREGVTVAGPRRFKFGTRVRIEGVGVRVIQDRLSKRFDDRFDIYFEDHQAALRFGKRRLKITIIEPST